MKWLTRIHISLRTTIFTVFFCFSLLMIAGVLYIQLYRENQTLNVMSERIIDTRGEAVRNALNYYLNIPEQANSIAGIFVKTLDYSDKEASFYQIRDYLYKIMTQSFNRDSLLSSIAFGSIDGDYVGFSRDLETNWTFQIKKNHETGNKLVFYKNGSSTSPVMDTVDDYNLFARPWFSQVNRSRHSEWTSAYRDVNSDSGVSISYSSPLTDKRGHYVGVVSSDLRLSRLNRYLASLTATQHSLIYLVNDRQQIIAASEPRLLLGESGHGLAEQSGTGLPLVQDSAEPVVKASARYLAPGEGNIHQIDVGGSRYYSKVIQVGDAVKLRGWRMVVLVSKQELLGAVSGYREMTIVIVILLVLIGGLLAHRILSVIVNPLRRIAEQAPQIAHTRKIEHNEGWSFDEINTLDNALHRMARDLDSAFARLEDQINIDSETGLFTRKGLISEFGEDRQFHGVMAMVSLSKLQTNFNNLGCDYAARYLEAFIQFVYRTFPGDTVLVRDSIDRLIVCCPGKETRQMDALAARMLNLMQLAESEYATSRFVFMGYVGVVTCAEGCSLQAAMTNASIAHQAARHRHSAKGCLYDASLREQALNNISMLNQLYGAIPNNELYLVYQPIVTIGREAVDEAECLVRWNSPELGMVRPDLFIQIAEESGFIIQLGRWIFSQACRELGGRIAARLCSAMFKLHVNVSNIELSQPDFCRFILSTIAANGLNTRNISIEITETSMINGYSELKETLSTLRSAGVTIAIDDFGSGFSSLSWLHKLEFDTLKIDRNFVMDVEHNPRNASIISAVIRIAEGFGVPLIAEGVENEQVLEKLRSMGCAKAQGYYFSRPLPFDQWPAALVKH
ncbi:hypothetical protein ABW09_17160 [Pluralibacter gergoviae]|uniref:bifunctional diguanylate cyclase/phosphodiesterase n=1 Tax=Pluralibacter gergoviae TaxID=61647 RepID=UPI000650323C|nr:EAL domain-containing protein [Pluralibacter gergoviae]KMK16957.1 hypothetical protein ABW09_17160 [Pluralibacter gergoviae]